jgi:hypothetical protein
MSTQAQTAEADAKLRRRKLLFFYDGAPASPARRGLPSPGPASCCGEWTAQTAQDVPETCPQFGHFTRERFGNSAFCRQFAFALSQP